MIEVAESPKRFAFRIFAVTKNAEVTGVWWRSWSSKPVWGSRESRVGSIPIRLRQFPIGLSTTVTNPLMPRRAICASLAVFFGLVLLVHGYTRPGLQVVGKKEVDVKMP